MSNEVRAGMLLVASPALLDPNFADTVILLLDALRIFAGYAGWGAGQLDDEIAEGSWYVVPGHDDDVFREETTELRREVMRRQPGELAWHSTRPADPDLN